MDIDKTLFITYQPMKCSYDNYRVFNDTVIQALSDIMTTGDVSKMRNLNNADISSLLKPQIRSFYDETIKWFKQNKDVLSVLRNQKDVLLFFSKGKGRKLMNNLYREGKIINWPVLAAAISEPSFDFSNSSVYDYYINEGKRLETKYSQRNSLPSLDPENDNNKEPVKDKTVEKENSSKDDFGLEM